MGSHWKVLIFDGSITRTWFFLPCYILIISNTVICLHSQQQGFKLCQYQWSHALLGIHMWMDSASVAEGEFYLSHELPPCPTGGSLVQWRWQRTCKGSSGISQHTAKHHAAWAGIIFLPLLRVWRESLEVMASWYLQNREEPASVYVFPLLHITHMYLRECSYPSGQNHSLNPVPRSEKTEETPYTERHEVSFPLCGLFSHGREWGPDLGHHWKGVDDLWKSRKGCVSAIQD